MDKTLKLVAVKALVIALVVGAAYAPAVRSGFVWDDDYYVTANPLLADQQGLAGIWTGRGVSSQYFPLVYTVFWLQRALWGLDPFGYHLVNVLLHVGNAFLLWRALALLRVPGSWLGALFFAIHPVQVESVAWISELKNVLSTFLLLSAFLWWHRFLVADEGRRRAPYVLSLVLFVLALLAKTTAMVLPAVCLILAWMGRLTPLRRVLLSLAPHAAAGLGMGLLTIWWERTVIGTQGALFDLPLIERLLVAGRSWWFYLAKLAWPSGLAFSYPRWSLDPGQGSHHLWYLAGFVALLLAARFNRDAAGALLIHLVCLAPLLGFIPLATFQYTFVADHYQYLALAGPLSLLAALCQRIPDASRARRFAGLLVPLGVVVIWMVVSRQHAQAFLSEETLWRDTLAKNPGSWMARNNLGLALLDQDKPAAAAEQFTLALALKPEHANAMSNLGLASEALGDRKSAGFWYRRALKIQPRHGGAANNLAILLEKEGRPLEAEATYRAILARLPDYHEARFNYAKLVTGQGRTAEAERLYTQLLAAHPDDVQARVNLAVLLTGERRFAAAAAHYRAALRFAPDDTAILFDAARVRLSMGERLEAMNLLARVLRLDPAHSGALRLSAALGASAPPP